MGTALSRAVLRATPASLWKEAHWAPPSSGDCVLSARDASKDAPAGLGGQDKDCCWGDPFFPRSRKSIVYRVGTHTHVRVQTHTHTCKHIWTETAITICLVCVLDQVSNLLGIGCELRIHTHTHTHRPTHTHTHTCPPTPWTETAITTCLLCFSDLQSPTIWEPGSSFVEYNFYTDRGQDYRMIQVHLFAMHIISNLMRLLI